MIERPKIPDYLEHRIEEEVDQDELSQIRDKMTRPIGSLIEFGERAALEIVDRDYIVEFSYESFKEDRPFIIPINWNSRKQDIRRITHFILRSRSSGKKIDLLERLSPNVSIYFDSTARRAHATDLASAAFRFDLSRDFSSVTLNIYPLSFASILVLMHEIGHAVIYERLSQNSKETFEAAYIRYDDIAYGASGSKFGDADEGMMERVLIEERGAWSFALNGLKRVLPLDVPLEEVLIFVHGYNLKSYTDTMAKRLNELIDLGVLKDRKKITKT